MTGTTPREPAPGAEQDPDDIARLYLALGRMFRTLRREAPESPVGHGGLSALATLTREGPMRVGELAALEGVGAPSTTRLIGSLEGLGLVHKRPDPDDGRACVVEATDDGARLVGAGREARMAALRQRVADLTPEQREMLRAAVPVLERLGAVVGEGTRRDGPDA